MASPTSLVFVDSTINPDQLLRNGVLAESELIVLNVEQDGVEQITAALADRRGIQSLHIVSQGSASSLKLGSGYLTIFSLESYGWHLQVWGESLALNADILLYGSDTATSEQDKVFMQRLSLLTGAKIAASCYSTGRVILGTDRPIKASGSRVKPLTSFAI